MPASAKAEEIPGSDRDQGSGRLEAGDPPEATQDNRQPLPPGALLGRRAALRPAVVLLVLFTLIESQLLYAFGRYRRRAYIPILVLTAIGIALGQLWANAGFVSFKIGEADVLPGLLFGIALQPLARRFPSPSRWRPGPTQIDEQSSNR